MWKIRKSTFFVSNSAFPTLFGTKYSTDQNQKVLKSVRARKVNLIHYLIPYYFVSMHMLLIGLKCALNTNHQPAMVYCKSDSKLLYFYIFIRSESNTKSISFDFLYKHTKLIQVERNKHLADFDACQVDPKLSVRKKLLGTEE